MPEDRTLELFDELLRVSLGERLSTGAASFLDIITDDAVMEFPFSPPGLPRRLNGRVEIESHLAGLGSLLRIDHFTQPKVHQTDEGSILEFSCKGQASQTGQPYDQDYISVITLRAGRITLYRDYWNPLVVLGAMTPNTESGAGLTDV